MRICIIFNPRARGDKARHFLQRLDEFGAVPVLKKTQSAGDARRLAAEAVHENFDIVVAAGGDGTVNEVINGIGDVPDGFQNTRLAVLPLGTVNVFAKDLNIPQKLTPAWETILAAKETSVDLPRVEFGESGERRYFVQLAGAGLDAKAIELASWELKKKLGPIAYVVAAFQANGEDMPLIRIRMGSEQSAGEMVLLGNGRFYGGSFRVFPEAEFQDGLLHVCVFPDVGIWQLFRAAPRLLLGRGLSSPSTEHFKVKSVTLESESKVCLQVDGELIGHLPAKFDIEPKGLRVIVP